MPIAKQKNFQAACQTTNAHATMNTTNKFIQISVHGVTF